jgi:hypothetical protein
MGDAASAWRALRIGPEIHIDVIGGIVRAMGICQQLTKECLR